MPQYRPKYVSEFDEMLFTEASEQGYVLIIGKGIDTKNIPVTDLKDYIDGKSANHLIVTARKQDNEYVVDRTYQQVLNAIQNQITPILRVVYGDGYKYFNLIQYGDDAIVFGAPLTTKVVNSEEKAVIPTFTLTQTSFYESTRELTSTACGVDIQYTEVSL